MLSAAHCNPPEYVLIGQSFTHYTDEQNTHRVKSSHTHGKYKLYHSIRKQFEDPNDKYFPELAVYDLRILKLVESVRFAHNVYPVLLPTPHMSAAGQSLELYGHGSIRKLSFEEMRLPRPRRVHPAYLEMINNKMMDWGKCQAKYENVFKDTPLFEYDERTNQYLEIDYPAIEDRRSQMCTKVVNGKGTCFGDSGSKYV